jgi:uncharacterized Rossmann fold enzyme
MLSPTDVRRALAARLACLDGVEAHVAPAETDYSSQGLDRMRFNVRIVVGPVGVEQAEGLLDELIAAEGDRSVKALLEADRRLDGLVADLDVPRCSGWQTFRREGHDAIGATWTVTTLS